MKMNKTLSVFTAVFLAFAFVACDNDDDNGSTTPPPAGDEEVITDLELTFQNADTQTSETFIFSDPDGPGGNAPTIDVISLTPGVYSVSIKVLDASDPNDVEDLTNEIAVDEADEHQFFFEPLNGAADIINITYADLDGDGNPIGQQTVWLVSDATSGSESVRITLLHEPNKDAPGAFEGVLSPEIGGETDIEVEFAVTVTQ
jgi:hypothetical protein